MGLTRALRTSSNDARNCGSALVHDVCVGFSGRRCRSFFDIGVLQGPLQVAGAGSLTAAAWLATALAVLTVRVDKPTGTGRDWRFFSFFIFNKNKISKIYVE